VPALACLLVALVAASAWAVEEPKEQKDKRMAWWREARFGMFIHWGIYSVPAGEWKGRKIGGIGEWIMNGAKVPVDEYEPLVGQFNPVKFDARQWARIAKDAGMKYVVITSKHHDGFCLWDSKLTGYTIMSTPFKRDILKELSEACKAEGVRLCFYHSIMDWHHPDYLPRRPWDPRAGVEAKFDRYIEHLKGQLKELVTGYDPGVLWFDGEWENTWTHEHGRMLYDYVRSLKSGIIVNNRVDKGRKGMQGMTEEGEFRGDFGTPEQEIPATGIPGMDWETCMTMNDTWGYKKDDQHWKSGEDLIRKLSDIASKGGNFLLNVGPTSEGLIPQPSVERLAAMGKWLGVNGESIYSTTASPFKKLAWGRCTRKPGKLYLHVFNWPPGAQLDVPGLKNKVTKAYLLCDKDAKALEVTQAEGKISLAVPAEAPDKVDTVVVLEIEGDPDVDVSSTAAIPQSPDGTVALKAADAALHGESVQYESGDGKDNVGYWTNAGDWVGWDFTITKPGEFTVEIAFACDDGSGDSEYTVGVGDQKLSDKIEATGSWTDFKSKELGKIKLDKAGRHTLEVRATSKPNLAVMNLKSITLKSVK